MPQSEQTVQVREESHTWVDRAVHVWNIFRWRQGTFVTDIPRCQGGSYTQRWLTVQTEHQSRGGKERSRVVWKQTSQVAFLHWELGREGEKDLLRVFSAGLSLPPLKPWASLAFSSCLFSLVSEATQPSSIFLLPLLWLTPWYTVSTETIALDVFQKLRNAFVHPKLVKTLTLHLVLSRCKMWSIHVRGPRSPSVC